MKRPLFHYVALFLATSRMVSATPEPQPQMSFTEGGSGTWNADWQGVAGRTYFLQWSLNLEQWHYGPLVEFGTGVKSFGIDTQGEEKFFVRLVFINDETVTSLQEARNADFDGDAIPNWFEVEEVGSNPFDKNSAGGDSDADGLADGWELFYFSDLVSADPNGKNSPDGLTNKEKSELGLGPNGDDPGLTTERIAYDYDGERLDGVTYYTQREFYYVLDGNGNLEVTTSDQ